MEVSTPYRDDKNSKWKYKTNWKLDFVSIPHRDDKNGASRAYIAFPAYVSIPHRDDKNPFRKGCIALELSKFQSLIGTIKTSKNE